MVRHPEFLRRGDVAQQKDFDPSVAHLEYLMEGRKGEKSRKLKVYDATERREIDSELTNRTIDFMQRSMKAGKPFFAYVPITQVHMPTEPSKKFAGSTGNGDFADVLAEMDDNVGRILDAVSELKISDNTIVIFTSDNGPEDTMPWRGWAGPWSGTYVTAMEGSLRVPFIIRWPGKIPADRVSNEMLHKTDIFTTLAKLGGADIPTDRAIDGVDQRDFLLGRKEKSAREFIAVFQGKELYAVKWRKYKMHFVWQERMHGVPQKLAVPRLIDLYDNPQETIEETTGQSSVVTRAWVLHAIFAELYKLKATLAKDPLIPMGTLDPYLPPTEGTSNPPLELPVPAQRDEFLARMRILDTAAQMRGPASRQDVSYCEGFRTPAARARRTSSVAAGIRNPSHFRPMAIVLRCRLSPRRGHRDGWRL